MDVNSPYPVIQNDSGLQPLAYFLDKREVKETSTSPAPHKIVKISRAGVHLKFIVVLAHMGFCLCYDLLWFVSWLRDFYYNIAFEYVSCEYKSLNKQLQYQMDSENSYSIFIVIQQRILSSTRWSCNPK